MASTGQDFGPPTWADEFDEDPDQIFIPGPIISDADEFGTLISATVASEHASRLGCSAVSIRILPIGPRHANALRHVAKNISETVHSPLVLKHIGVWNISSTETWLVSERRGCVSIENLLSSIHSSDVESVVSYIARKSLEALKVLREKYSQPHTDLRPGSIYLCEEGTLCFGDVGIYHVLREALSSRRALPGIKLWPLPDQGSSFSSMYDADIWDLGVSLLFIAEGGSAVARLWRSGRRTPRLINPARWSAQFSSFLALLFTCATDHTVRMDELLQHRFVAGSSSSACVAVMAEYLSNRKELIQGQYTHDSISALFRQNDVVVRVPLISIDDISTDHFSYERWTGIEESRPTVEMSLVRILKTCKEQPLPKGAQECKSVAHTVATLETFLETADMA